VKLISPAPPRSLVMSTGAVDGAYQAFGLKYQALLKANGIALELKPSTGSIENLGRLNTKEATLAHQQLDRIETEVTGSKFPLDFAGRVYTLRQHVGFVRQSLPRRAGL